MYIYLRMYATKNAWHSRRDALGCDKSKQGQAGRQAGLTTVCAGIVERQQCHHYPNCPASKALSIKDGAWLNPEDRAG